MRITEFDIYKNLLEEKSGIIVEPDQSYLLESRLSPIAKKWGYASLGSMTIALQGVPDNALVSDIIEAVTTNETSFFRNHSVFNALLSFVIPQIQKQKGLKKTLNIWCAGASSGQEPYSIAMLAKEHENDLFSGWKTAIIATDLSNEILERAKEGLYTQFEVQRGLPVQLLIKYFSQEHEGKWRIIDAIRNIVEHKSHNLIENSSHLGTFDIIFCCNVLKRFNDAMKKTVLERMHEQLGPHGVICLGQNETVIGITELLLPLPGNPNLYVPKDSPHLSTATVQVASKAAAISTNG